MLLMLIKQIAKISSKQFILTINKRIGDKRVRGKTERSVFGLRRCWYKQSKDTDPLFR